MVSYKCSASSWTACGTFTSNLALAEPAGVTFAAAFLVYHGRLAALGTQVANLHDFFNPKNVRAKRRMVCAI